MGQHSAKCGERACRILHAGKHDSRAHEAECLGKQETVEQTVFSCANDRIMRGEAVLPAAQGWLCSSGGQMRSLPRSPVKKSRVCLNKGTKFD